MKKIIKLFVFICICFMPFMADAKLTYTFDWEVPDKEFYFSYKNKYMFVNFYGSNDEIYLYDKDGKFLEIRDITEEDEQLKNLLIHNDNSSVYYEEKDVYYHIDYRYEDFSGYEKVDGVTSYKRYKFADDLDFTKKILGQRYDIHLLFKNTEFYIRKIVIFEDYYVVNSYANDYSKQYVHLYNSDLEEKVKLEIDKDFDYATVYVQDGLIYLMVDNITLDVYKFDGTKYGTINVENDYLGDSKIVDSCYNLAFHQIFVENNELILYYRYLACPMRVIMPDENVTVDIVKAPDIDCLTLKYSLDFDVDKVGSDKGDFTYEKKIDEDGKSYIELDIKPKDGYSVEKIIVTDLFGNKMEVIDNKFYRPMNDVTIEVKYVEGEYLPIPDTGLSQSITLIIIGLILIGLGSYTFKYVKE